MNRTYCGGCACGAVRYQTTSTPIFENHCQCRDCQRASGTGHGSYLTFADRAGMVIAGQVSTWRHPANSGNDKTHAFCPQCGTPLYVTFAAMPDLIAIHAASLDDPGLFSPQAITYASRAQPWDWLDPALPLFAHMPPA